MSREVRGLLHKGSVKDIYKSSEENELIFKFSDRYSVFDWGEMPDSLIGKGEALAKMGSFFFNFLGNADSWKSWKAPSTISSLHKTILSECCQSGMSHHFLGQIEDLPNSMVVSTVDVPKLKFENGTYDYQVYAKRPQKTLVPLEVIFRFGVPEGSSLFDRIDDSEYRQVLGLKNIPQKGEWLNNPVIEYSTKLESSDRYLGYDEAQSISGLSDSEFAELHAMTQLFAYRLFDFFKDHQIELWDGKVEWAFGDLKENGDRNFMLVDSIGPDELRLSHKEMKLSKEFLRGFYRETPWLDSVSKEKKAAFARGERLWKDKVIETYGNPPALDPTFLNAGVSLYKTLSNVLTESLTQEEENDQWAKLLQLMERTKVAKGSSEISQEARS